MLSTTRIILSARRSATVSVSSSVIASSSLSNNALKQQLALFSRSYTKNSIINITSNSNRNNNLQLLSGSRRCCTKRWNSNSSSGGRKGNDTTAKVSSEGGTPNPSPTKQSEQSFFERFLGPKPMPPRNTMKWYGEMILLCTVFGITGSSTMFLVRPAVGNVLGLEGSMKDGMYCFCVWFFHIFTCVYSIANINILTFIFCPSPMYHAYMKRSMVIPYSLSSNNDTAVLNIISYSWYNLW